MDGNGGCCIARYAGGAYDNEKIDRIMLRFRPIAPKPATDGSVGASPDSNNGALFKTTRTKRRYVKDRRSCGGGRKRKVASSEEKTDNEAAVFVTLPLLPEDPVLERSGSSSRGDETVMTKPEIYMPKWHNRVISFEQTFVMPQAVRPVGSCVIVERVTETCADGEMLRLCTHVERKVILDMDACPGFLSDRENKVVWTNEAYRRMVNQDGGHRPEMTWLVVREKLPELCRAFVCRVRLQYTCGKGKSSMTVPCDVWRMENGEFVWRLDVKAALSLGR